MEWVVDTGSTTTAVSEAEVVHPNTIREGAPVQVQFGGGEIVWSKGSVDVPIKLGEKLYKT